MALHSDAIVRDFSFGEQVNVVVVNDKNVKFFVKYASKYVTKAATDALGFAHKFSSLARIDALHDSAWWPRLVDRVAWLMGEDPRFAKLKLQDHAHTFGFGGWFLSKSRGWSVTFGMLKELRVKWAIDHAKSEFPTESNVPLEFFEDDSVKWGVVAFGWYGKVDGRLVRKWWHEYKEAWLDSWSERRDELEWKRLAA